MTSQTRESLPQAIVRLRILVLALGESVETPWWRCEFLNDTGLRFLERLYPRTAFQAAIDASGRVACGVHDSSIGNKGVYHLFRLPESTEGDVRTATGEFADVLAEETREIFGDPAKLTAALAQLGVSSSPPASGPLRMGTAEDLEGMEAYERMAVAYSQAFSAGVQVFPYFEAENNGRR